MTATQARQLRDSMVSVSTTGETNLEQVNDVDLSVAQQQIGLQTETDPVTIASGTDVASILLALGLLDRNLQYS